MSQMHSMMRYVTTTQCTWYQFEQWYGVATKRGG
jgi:hypothetical protein